MAVAVKGSIIVEGEEISVSNPAKLLWPEAGITKLEYLQKLTVLAPYLLRYCQGRYLTTIRYPNGVDGKSFYQKSVPQLAPPFVKTAEFQGLTYINLDSLPTLIWLGNLACLEFHPTFNFINDTLPAEWVVDIDPTLEEEPRIMQAALLVGEALDQMGIQAVPKTSGATGVQMFIPIERRYTFDQLRTIGQFLGSYLVQKYPQIFTIERLKKNRGGLIYIDYLQHWYGKTLSAPYTPRAKRFATVSTPMYWDEIRQGCQPQDFTLLTIEERLAKTGDLIAKLKPQSLDSTLAILK